MDNKLVFSNLTLTRANLYGGVNYTHTINEAEDLEVGIASSAQVTFDCDQVVSGSFTYLVKHENDNDYRQIGVFNVQTVTHDKYKYTVTAYDNVSKFDVIIDSWLAGLTFPITLGNMFASLCTYIGVTPESTTFANSTYSIPAGRLSGTNITGRAILGWIASAAGGFAMATALGKIKIGTYTANATTLDRSKYKSLEISQYVVPKINKVIVAVSDDDIGISSGTGNNILKIINDPLLYTDTTIQTQVDNIYSVLNAYSTYYAGTIELYQDFGICVGDVISVNSLTFFVMSKEMKANGVIFTSKGNESRNVTTTESYMSYALNGKFHEFQNDIDGLTSRVGDAEGEVSDLSQSVSDISASVSGKLDATGGTTSSCSWVLNSTSWTVKVNNTDKFRVNSQGAYINGQVEATSGKIGGWHISSSMLANLDNSANRVQIDPINARVYMQNNITSAADSPTAIYNAEKVELYDSTGTDTRKTTITKTGITSNSATINYLYLGNDPTSNMMAATKKYVDDHAGGSFTIGTVTSYPESSRRFGVAYTNNTGKPLWVVIAGWATTSTSGNANLIGFITNSGSNTHINVGQIFASDGNTNVGSMSFLVPAGGKYGAEQFGTEDVYFSYWTEATLG